MIRTGQGRPGFWVDGHALWDAKVVVKYSFMNEDAWIPQARLTEGDFMFLSRLLMISSIGLSVCLPTTLEVQESPETFALR